MINENEKQDKILNFNIIVGNQNNNVANEFLTLANWNISQAVNLYLYTNSNPNNPYINNQYNLPIFKYITEYSFVKPGILGKFSSLIQLPFLKDNEECCYKFIGKINNLVKTGEIFTNLLKTNKGVIILYNKDTFYKVFEQLDVINNDYQNNYINSIVIYPIIDNSIEGKNLINNMHINRFPCYLFCQYKSKDVFYIIDKMEGIFYLQTFKNTLFPQIYNSNINNINNFPLNNNKINNNIQSKQDKENNNVNNNNKGIVNNNDQKNCFNNNQVNNKSNNYNNQIQIKNEDKISKNNNLFNKDLSLLNNDNKKPENNNNQININQSINFNNKENNISHPSQPQQKKEYIPDYRNYEFEDNFIYPGFNPNPIQPQPQIPVYPNNNLNDESLLSDSQLRKFQDNEMKKLEKMEEEKEKKERQEKEKIRKEEEEKKKREEKLKEDKEIFSMLIPPEPEDNNPDKCIIIFRLPDGEKNIQRKFLKTHKIAVLYDYIRSLGKEIYSDDEYNNFSIIQTFPFKNFENKLNNTLEEEGLFPNSVLQIKENE